MEALAPEEIFKRAAMHFASGELRQSEPLLRSILHHGSVKASSFHLLGLIAYQTARPAEAVELLRRAIAADPDEAEYRNHLGLVLFSLGQLNEAIAEFHRVIESKPDFADVRNSLGAALKRKGNVEQAITWYRQAIALRSDFPEALNNLGTALQDLGKLDEAIDSFRKAVAARPTYAEALSNLANALRLKDQPAEAIRLLRQAALIRPDMPEIHYNLGLALQSDKQFEQAASAYRQALSLRPQYADALNNLGNVLEEMQKFDEAISAYRQVLSLRPDLPEAHNNLGTALKQTGQLDDAILYYRQAIALRPDFVAALSNLGNGLGEAGLLDEAETAFQKALALQPDYHEASWNLGLLWLLRGDFERGWEAYEARNRLAIRLSPSEETNRVFMETLWRGEELHGKRILLLGEQGLGDTIHFIRYAPRVAARGGRVLLYCQPRLKNLLTGQLDIEEVIQIGQELSSFDFCCPLMSLPNVFGTREQTIPANVPYLRTDAPKVENWRRRIEVEAETEIRIPNVEIRNKSEIQKGNDQNSGLEHSNLNDSNLFRISDFEFRASRPMRVGLVWAGNPTYRNDRNRSIPLTAFKSLFSVPGVRFFSLQKGPAVEQLKTFAIGNRHSAIGNVIDWTSDLHDFTDTAALIQNLDLIISVDTAVAHLAGALAKPVWLLLPLTPDWRWMLGRSDTPWYPTMRLFRQPRRGDWQTPIHRIASELANVVRSVKGAGDTKRYNALQNDTKSDTFDV